MSGNNETEAKLYDCVSPLHQMPHGLGMINQLAITEGNKILDLGCGTGKLTAVLAERVGTDGYVVGVDPDEGRIKIANDSVSNGNLKYEVGDGETFPEGNYDVIFSNFVLHWIEHLRPVFERVYNNLCPGGQFAFISTLHLPKIGYEMNALMGPQRETYANQKFFSHTVQEYEELAVNVGFKVVLKRADVLLFVFPDIESVIEFWFASSSGIFDPKVVDNVQLDEFKKKYDQTPIQIGTDNVLFILTK